MPPSVGCSPPETFRFAPSLPLSFACGLPSCSRADAQQCGMLLPLRGVATPGHGKGEGSAGDKFRVSGTQETVEGAEVSEANGVLRNPYHPPGVTIYMEKRLTNELPFCRLGPLMKIIEQANRPHSSVEWHFACSMRSKGRHRAGLSALQPPGTPLTLLDELHEG